MAYAERFGLEPHNVDPPLRWWLRVNALDEAKAQRLAREFVERHGLDKADADTKRLYNDLVLTITGKNHGS